MKKKVKRCGNCNHYSAWVNCRGGKLAFGDCTWTGKRPRCFRQDKAVESKCDDKCETWSEK